MPNLPAIIPAAQPTPERTVIAPTAQLLAHAPHSMIARMMELSNAIGALLRLISPFAPHIAEECWEGMGNHSSIFLTPWPEHNESFLLRETMTIVIQVNGKLRDSIEVPVDISDEELKSAARTEKVAKHLEGKIIRKVVVVAKKLVNFVV